MAMDAVDPQWRHPHQADHVDKAALVLWTDSTVGCQVGKLVTDGVEEACGVLGFDSDDIYVLLARGS
jgi:hypothetical protein|tara:strand:- start:11802 stop:12002 length:201 start_codon:yes stop_codon:yes gene_type:complete